MEIRTRFCWALAKTDDRITEECEGNTEEERKKIKSMNKNQGKSMSKSDRRDYKNRKCNF